MGCGSHNFADCVFYDNKLSSLLANAQETLTNSEDPDVMPLKAIFHQDLHCLLRQNKSSEKQMQYILKSITCDPSI